MVRRWGLAWAVALAAVLIIGPALIRPGMRDDVLGESSVLYLVSWMPMLIGIVMAWGLVRAFGRRDELDRRIASAMDGHPVLRELGWMVLLIAGFILSMVVLSWIFTVYGEETGVSPDLAMSVALVSRLLFLFAIPLLILDRSGLTVDGKGTAMPSIALKVGEPWRWLGVVPVFVTVVLMGFLITPHIGLPEPSLTLYAMLVAFMVIATCEEIFFRGMMQTRLELLLGRWGGIVLTSVVFAMTYAFIQPYDAVSQLPGIDFVHDTGMALLTYGAAGLFYGYLWACFRNTWINVLMRVAMFLLILPPDLQIGISR
ncbi:MULTISPECIES: CPBP family intramembrane glutamic endopeptidase [Nocardiopsis]|uniref:CPBP family intramembrane glutamic endopeptidase n=1 Tax=Nocardiopsis TaxID=2013 RepID=UPI00034C8F15|nr:MULTISPECIES: CPBP family intramembrane glutamic endopeptidase [Nocardiopsis]PWV45109.1 CAAX prenyl protease-like protein [Nocardiopsis sp. L17-MgMaSL7]